jgi:nitrogen fixation NifU-like protein
MALDALYLERILEHYRNPRNHGALEPCDAKARGNNPNCGDDVTVYLRLGDGVLDEVAFTGKGCAISLSAASMMTEAVSGLSMERARELLEAFTGMMEQSGGDVAAEAAAGGAPTGGSGAPRAPGAPGVPGDLGVLAGVKQYPARIKCATLCWQALGEALEEVSGD